jgi:hypothetical protein
MRSLRKGLGKIVSLDPTKEEKSALAKIGMARMRRAYPYGFLPDALFFMFGIFYMKWGWGWTLGLTVLTSAILHGTLYDLTYGLDPTLEEDLKRLRKEAEDGRMEPPKRGGGEGA